MKKLIFSLVVIIVVIACNTTSPLKQIESNGFVQIEDFGMRTKPVLNREYLSYLCWTISVFGESYPEKVWGVLPPELLDLRNQYPDIDELIRNSTGRFRDYTLNPKYLNYPHIGLSSNQYLELTRWMTDRYNEAILIRSGIFNFNIHQKDEDSFNTEAYLVYQYQGSIRKEGYLSWKDKQFLPCMRLPFAEEIAQLERNDQNLHQIRPYPFSKKDFLWYWDELFLDVDNKDQALVLNPFNPIRIKLSTDSEPPKEALPHKLLKKKEEVLTDLYRPAIEGVREIEDFSDYPFEEKDWHGRMPFIIVGSDKLGNALAMNGSYADRCDDVLEYDRTCWLTYNTTIIASED